MSDSMASLSRQIGSATELHAVVRAMKALAASNIGQYEAALRALEGYGRNVELGLGACLRGRSGVSAARPAAAAPLAIVFGSDQGLLGQFNEVLAQQAIATLAALAGPPRILAVGARVHALLCDAGMTPEMLFPVPHSAAAIAPLMTQLQLLAAPAWQEHGALPLYICHNRPDPAAVYQPCVERVLPLDAAWQRRLAAQPWPQGRWPGIIGDADQALARLIGEYLFLALFRAGAESLASENASRLAAMTRADNDIGQRLKNLGASFNRLRQDAIDEELFDVIAATAVPV